ncbi:CHAD domain-containing protein [Trichothermofontia sp.]
MAKVPTDDSQAIGRIPAAATATVEQYAHALIQKHYRRMISREALVLKDKDPEDLHQMRVAIRRLQTALQIFKAAIVLPKAAQIKSLQGITRQLGKLRDLDVQLDTLKTEYAEKLDPSEQGLLQQAIAALAKQRKKVFAKVKTVLKSQVYQDLKVAYENWLDRPRYTLSAQQSLALVLPELLSPLLAELLLHPGWLIAANDQTAITSPILHDLRKTCKHVRYQAEFFTDFYEPAFKQWIQEIKGLQDSLGQVHDIQVLQQILLKSVPEWGESIHLRQMIEAEHEKALGLWRSVQAKYLSPDYRLFLHQLLLSPLLARSVMPVPSNGVKGEAIAATPEDDQSQGDHPEARVALAAQSNGGVAGGEAEPISEAKAGEDSVKASVVEPSSPTVTKTRRQTPTTRKSPGVRTPRSPRRRPQSPAGN